VAEYWKEADVCEVIVGGAAGCRAMNEGIRRARSSTTSGKTVKRYGSRQMNVYTARKESVCVVVCHERRRMTFDWKSNTTPMRALKRRKLADIVGREKEGRVVKSLEGVSEREEERSSTGITCCNNFSSSLSCILDPVSEAFPCAFLKFSFKFFPCCKNLSLFLSGVKGTSASSDRSSV